MLSKDYGKLKFHIVLNFYIHKRPWRFKNFFFEKSYKCSKTFLMRNFLSSTNFININ